MIIVIKILHNNLYLNNFHKFNNNKIVHNLILHYLIHKLNKLMLVIVQLDPI